MERRRSKTKFWTVLALANLLVMMYPVNVYVNAYTNDAQVFAAVVLVGVAVALAITDVVSAVLAYVS